MIEERRSYQPFTRLDKVIKGIKKPKGGHYAHFSIWMDYEDYMTFKLHCKEKKKSMSRVGRSYLKEGMNRWKK